MCYAVFENLKQAQPKNHFTVGIDDDVTHTSLDCSKRIHLDFQNGIACKFYGLGSDGTVGSNKNSIKIIGNHTELFVQGYFCYDSRKSGGSTVSHVRFSNKPIRASYLIDNADFVACHNPSYLSRFDMLSDCKDNGVFLLNCPCKNQEELENFLPNKVKRQIAKKRLRCFIIDATKIANDVGLNGRTGTIMQAAFFLLNPTLLPYALAKKYLIEEVTKLFAKKGDSVVQMNVCAIERTENAVWETCYPATWRNLSDEKSTSTKTTNYFDDFIQPVLSLRGDTLPVSAFSPDGHVKTGTTKLEKHGVPFELPRWIGENCIQCNQCSFSCPHACIRPILINDNALSPQSFITVPAKGIENTRFRIQVSPRDCMGCGVCANVCPAKEKALIMQPNNELLPQEDENWNYAQNVPQRLTLPFYETALKEANFIRRYSNSLTLVRVAVKRRILNC